MASAHSPALGPFFGLAGHVHLNEKRPQLLERNWGRMLPGRALGADTRSPYSIHFESPGSFSSPVFPQVHGLYSNGLIQGEQNYSLD
jgi:hypothetical protein